MTISFDHKKKKEPATIETKIVSHNKKKFRKI